MNIILSGGSGCRKNAKTDCGSFEKKPEKPLEQVWNEYLVQPTKKTLVKPRKKAQLKTSVHGSEHSVFSESYEERWVEYHNQYRI